MRLVPESRREALFPEHGERAEELLQREVLRRLPQGLFQEKQGRMSFSLSLIDFDTLLGIVDPRGGGGGKGVNTNTKLNMKHNKAN